MFSYVHGTLAEKLPTQVVIDVGGIGYEVFIPLSTYSRLPDEGENVRLLTHFHIREDVHHIFGFLTREERDLFKLLLTISGIGPKLALTALSGLEVVELKRAIIREDLSALTGISGIGRKTAERIIIELREKVLLDDKVLREKPSQVDGEKDVLVQDTLLVLVSLGYKKQDAQEAVKKVFPSATAGKISVEELVRASLKVI